MIKESFIHQTMTGTLSEAYTRQSEVAKTSLKPDTGTLFAFLERSPLETIREGKLYYMPTLTYLRFLDIHYRKKYGKRSKKRINLYNKPLFGIVYRTLIPRLRYGLRDEIREQIKEEISSSLNQE